MRDGSAMAAASADGRSSGTGAAAVGAPVPVPVDGSRLGTGGGSVRSRPPAGAAVRRPTASKSSDSWSPPPSAGGRTGRAEPQPDGRAAPATRAAGTDPSVATPRSASAASPARLPGHRRQSLDQRPELVLAEEPDDGLAVVVAETGRLEVELDRQVAHDRRQVLAHEHRVAVLDELVAQLVGLHLVDPLVERLERPELADELGGGLLPHPGNARDVVGRVALERLVVDHLARDEVVPLADPRRVVEDRVLDPGPRGHEARLVGDQLEHVEVAGHDRRVEAALLGVDDDRADHVVRLVARQLVDGDAQRLDHLADLGELVAQVVGHALAGRLVLGVLLVAEGRALEVEGDRDVVRLEVLDAAQDDAAEAEDGVDELALRRRQRREREISAVDQPVAIEQHQAFVGHGSSVAACPADFEDGPAGQPPKRRAVQRRTNSPSPVIRNATDRTTRGETPPTSCASRRLLGSSTRVRPGAAALALRGAVGHALGVRFLGRAGGETRARRPAGAAAEGSLARRP